MEMAYLVWKIYVLPWEIGENEGLGDFKVKSCRDSRRFNMRFKEFLSA